jgi:hypothetical protein
MKEKKNLKIFTIDVHSLAQEVLDDLEVTPKGSTVEASDPLGIGVGGTDPFGHTFLEDVQLPILRRIQKDRRGLELHLLLLSLLRWGEIIEGSEEKTGGGRKKRDPI